MFTPHVQELLPPTVTNVTDLPDHDTAYDAVARAADEAMCEALMEDFEFDYTIEFGEDLDEIVSVRLDEGDVMDVDNIPHIHFDGTPISTIGKKGIAEYHHDQSTSVLWDDDATPTGLCS